MFFKKGNSRWPDTTSYKASIDSAKKCSRPVCALSVNYRRENAAHKAAVASRRCIITFSARRWQHRKSVSCSSSSSSRAVRRSLTAAVQAPIAWRNYRTAFSHRPCIQTNGRTKWQDPPDEDVQAMTVSQAKPILVVTVWENRVSVLELVICTTSIRRFNNGGRRSVLEPQ